ncbi:MAG: hypothetical protein HYT75_04075, partial [Deltaproteobacteria bacterium]|nr:hypothetical protein [Deltaproteobacteria bacterium]
LDGSQSYAGVIDYTRIYSRAHPDYEILTMYNAGNVEFQTRTSADNSTWEAWMPTTSETQIDSLDGPSQYNTTDSGLVSYWPLDNGNMSGGTTADVKGTNTGTLYGTRSVDGKFGKARKFAGSEYIDLGSYTRGADLSVEAWIFVTSFSSDRAIWGAGNSACTNYEYLYAASTSKPNW